MSRSTGAGTAGRVARIVPDVTGIDKQFDYLVPEVLAPRLEVGSLVRIDLHGRRVGGWVVAFHDDTTLAPDALKPIAKVTGVGPDRSLVELAQWARSRWAARRLRSLLVAASPHRAVPALPPPRRTGSAPSPSSPATTGILDAGGGVLRLPPRVDVLPPILSAVARGPALVVVPEHGAAALLATRLGRANLSVATMPEGWAAAAGGVDVVIGTRSAAWARVPGLAAAVVIDEHDEALQEERTPTWHARDVVVERCRRAGVPYVLVSPAPTLVAVEEYAGDSGVLHPSRSRERAGWPAVTVVDRSEDVPWRRSLVTSPLIERLRDHRRRVVCISNITGRARVLACRSCRALVRCEACDAAVGLDDDGRLACRRCHTVRPAVCLQCGGSAFANLRPGVTRLREELQAAANRPAVALSARDPGDLDVDAPIVVGTEAALHRVPSADVVAFLEFDSEMLAPRFRASEQALALLVRAGRMAPEVLVQTFVPDHAVLRAAKAGDPGVVVAEERARRRALHLPPYGALASISGPGAEELVTELGQRSEDLSVGGSGDRWLVRAASWTELSRALEGAERPPGVRTRVEVDPPRV